MTTELWDRETFLENLCAIGTRAYHDKHPFHVGMNEGRLSREALRGWVANRFYYQQNIPIKDAAILSNCPLREVRRVWIHRILDHDGVIPRAVESVVLSGERSQSALTTAPATEDASENEGGIEAWLRQREAVRALQFKCDLLWSMLDAIHHAYGPFQMQTPGIASSAQPTLTRGVWLQTDSKTGNSVLLFPEGVLELNETAQEILNRCDGRTVSEIIQALAEEYNVDLEMLATDVQETLADLQRRNSIENTELTRRH